MRRLVLSLAAAALVLPLGAPPAAAHTGFEIVGLQYLYRGDFTLGVAGWLSLPTGPVMVSEGPTDDGLTSVTNRDAVRHTFTECTTSCDQVLAEGGNFAGATFDINVPAGTSADLGSLVFEGTRVFGCRVHPNMRGQITIHPA